MMVGVEFAGPFVAMTEVAGDFEQRHAAAKEPECRYGCGQASTFNDWEYERRPLRTAWTSSCRSEMDQV